MPSLADAVEVRGRFARSANLERDAGRSEPLDGYLVTPRALDVIGRITDAALAGTAGGAWSLTGPYGSGKSSLGLLLHAAFGPAGPAREMALDRIAEASPEAAANLLAAHRHRGTERDGFQRGLVTADREPIAAALARCLASAAERERERGKTEVSRATATRFEGTRSRPTSAGAVVETARRLAAERPLLLVVDEFGKALEAVRDGGDADPYVLQQLAEAGQGTGLPIFLLTLQHLAFEDTLTGADAARRREWAKVQGRFEDVAYVETPAATRAMIASVFVHRDGAFESRSRRWAGREVRKLAALGIAVSDRETLAACYPLHPLAALVLPALTSRYGQHERTLFSFLAGPDPSGAAKFLERTAPPAARTPLPSLGLDAVYDYFVGGGAASAAALSQSSRWTEVATRLRDVHGLTRRQARLAKSIALLNLVSTGGTLRASREVLLLAEPRGEPDLAALEARGVITWRDFAGEYRIWQGAETDVRRLLETCRARLAPQALADLLATASPPPPAVAARHSAKNELLRVFAYRFAGSGDPPRRPDAFAPHDGEILLFVGPPESAPQTAVPEDGKPVVLALPNNVDELDRAAREAAAVRMALDEPAIAGDPVARGEFHERLVHARAAFDHTLAAAFRGDACRFFLLGPGGREELRGGRGSAALSRAADRAYPDTPVLRNEMLQRTDLTSQAAKARRELLDAMIERSAEKDLGLAGYGPEVAMYRAALLKTGLHRRAAGGGWEFQRPGRQGRLRPAWDVVAGDFFAEARFRRVNLRALTEALLLPPVGMKPGAAPVFLTAVLLAHRDEIALYEHGTFKPALTSELCERLVKNPAHFEIKHFAAAAGARAELIAALAGELGIRPQDPERQAGSLVAVLRRLVSAARRWERFTRRTERLGDDARAVRDALFTAVEPDVFLFETLPAALGLPPAEAGAKAYPEARRLAQRVAGAMAEVEGHREHLLTRLCDLLLEESGATAREAVVRQAAALGDGVLDPEVRAFVLTLANDAAESDQDWANAVATVVAKKAPAEWADADFDRFRHELKHRMAAFRRLVALHADARFHLAAGGPFSALQVTFTRPDGAEHLGVVTVRDAERSEASRALDAALDALAEVAGSKRRGTEALLAVLGERLIGAEAELAATDGAAIFPERKAAHG